MKNILLFLILGLAACSSKPVKDPTPFQTGEQHVIILGCWELQKEVDAWNRTHPENQRVADC